VRFFKNRKKKEKRKLGVIKTDKFLATCALPKEYIILLLAQNKLLIKKSKLRNQKKKKEEKSG
jgi:hypothetical protein